MDDAGRGPVIGPLVVAGIRIEEEKLDRLRARQAEAFNRDPRDC